jgi:octaprenyl-diphosphate synthase
MVTSVAEKMLDDRGPHHLAEQSAVQMRSHLSSLYAPINDDLAVMERLMRESLESPSDFIRELVQRVQLYGGKRLRPALLLLAGKACGGITPTHHRLAACVELIHVATLVHDDVLDDADCRRHVATVNAEWGTEPSLLLGDFLFTHAFRLAAESPTPEACRWLGQSTNAICAGELHQVSRRGKFDLTESEYLEVLEGKTAELFACACRLGAFYSGADDNTVRMMGDFGRNLGVAFQIADDILDLVADSATTGKPQGSDLRKQKMTLPVIRFRDAASPEKVAVLQTLFEEPNNQTTERVRELLRGSDAVAYSEQRAMEFVTAAKQCLEHLDHGPAKESLLELTSFAVTRSA